MLGMCERRPCPGSVRLKTASFSLSYWLVPLLRGEHTHNHPSSHTLSSHHVVKDTTFIFPLFPCIAFGCVCVCVYVVVHVSITSCPHTHLICEILSVFKYRLTCELASEHFSHPTHCSRSGCAPCLTNVEVPGCHVSVWPRTEFLWGKLRSYYFRTTV